MNRGILTKSIIVIILPFPISIIGKTIGLNTPQILSICVFFFSILGSLFFWEFRLSFVLLGTSLLLATRVTNITDLIQNSSLEIILFLAGMMIIIGLLKNVGVFAWLVSLILRMKNLTAKKFMFILCIMSALSSCAVDEVTSIIFMVAAILEICDYFETNPTPFLISSVLATNIGSAGTVLGNPIGILIASKAGLTFEDFMLKAFPVMCVCLIASICILMLIYRNSLLEFNKKIKEWGSNEILIRLISIPPDIDTRVGLGIFGITLLGISLHHRFEIQLGLENNTILLVIPLISAGFIMIWQHKKAREFVEKDVEWWTLIFFLFLFAQAGVLMHTGATNILANHLVNWTKGDLKKLTGVILWTGTIGSSVLDNVVLVAAFIPIIKGLEMVIPNAHPLWWALLFGGCFGGNITIIGSTANIVAIGILEKERKQKIPFLKWFRVGIIVGIVTTGIVWLFLLILPM